LSSKRKFTVDDILKLSSITDVRVSSKGDVAFTISRNDLDRNKVFSEVHIVRSDGSKAYLVGEGDSLPRWNPSGDLLAFTSRRGASEEDKGCGLFVWTGSGEPRKVAWFKHGVTDMEWLSNDQVVLVTPTPREGFYDEDGDYVSTDRLPVWFDGRGFIAGLKYNIKLVDVNSGYIKDVAEELSGIACIEVCNDLIYYAVPIDWRNPTIHKLIRVNPRTGEKEVVLEGFSITSLRCVSNDLYALMHKQEIGIASHYKLWLVRDGRPECVTCGVLDRNIHVLAGGFLDGVALVYADSGSSILALIKDGRLRRITSEGNYVHIAHAGGDRVAYVLSSATKPQELYMYDGSKHIQLSSINEWVTKEVKLYEPHHEKIVVGSDEVEGWVLIPEGKGPHPLILYIHGGPKGMYGYYFHPEMQLMVSEGFAIAYANPRGSDGYSEEFADIKGKYGEVDYEQLMAFLDHVISKYPIDRGRLAVTGISYGGYMTNVIITKTRRFKAAVSENGIADWIADYWASDIGYWFDPDQIGGTPIDNIEEYVRKSPVFHADKVETPVLFIHSMQDYRCFIDQSLAMHVALAMRGKETKIVIFTKGSHTHSMRAEPRHRRKRYLIKIEWLKEKLGMKSKK